MPSEPGPGAAEALLEPVSAGAAAEAVSDAAVLAALVTAEVALARAWRTVEGRPAQSPLDAVFGWAGAGRLCAAPGIDPAALATAAVGGGNPVIPLVRAMRDRVGAEAAGEVHRGATSQDVLDSALLFVARRAGAAAVADLAASEAALAALAAEHRDTVTAARTLTQHAVPTTVGLRVAAWLAGIRRARARLEAATAQLPAQLGGAGGTLAAFVAHGGAAAAEALPRAFAAELALASPDAPWHTVRWPVTELGDALVQVADALGVFAADVATGARTEIGEWVVAEPGGSSAMPQKRNPTPAVLVRSAALRAPQLGATLHAAAALAVDERPDGAWHAEWPALRDLLRLVLGAASTARRLAEGLAVDRDAVAANLARTGGAIVAERLSIELSPVLGQGAVADLVARATDPDDLATLLRTALADAGWATSDGNVAAPRDAGRPVTDADLASLLDPAAYTGLAGELVDRVVECVDGGTGEGPA